MFNQLLRAIDEADREFERARNGRAEDRIS